MCWPNFQIQCVLNWSFQLILTGFLPSVGRAPSALQIHPECKEKGGDQLKCLRAWSTVNQFEVQRSRFVSRIPRPGKMRRKTYIGHQDCLDQWWNWCILSSTCRRKFDRPSECEVQSIPGGTWGVSFGYVFFFSFLFLLERLNKLVEKQVMKNSPRYLFKELEHPHFERDSSQIE
jgi:hypothetical protein